MPGLLRGVARTAVIAGTATAVSNRVSRRQANRWSRQADQQAYAQQPQYAAPPPQQYASQPPPQQYAPVYAAPAPAPPVAAAPPRLPVEQLKQLFELKEQGILSEEEFAAEKAKLLGDDLSSHGAGAMLFLYRPRQTSMPFRIPRGRAQQDQYNQQLQQGFAATRRVPPQPPSSGDPTSVLAELEQLHASGVMTDSELAAAKARVVGPSPGRR